MSDLRDSIKLIVFGAIMEVIFVYMYESIAPVGPPGLTATLLWTSIIWVIAVAVVIYILIRQGN